MPTVERKIWPTGNDGGQPLGATLHITPRPESRQTFNPRSTKTSARLNMAMYIDLAHINIQEHVMALQIANPAVVAKVERLARATGLTKTAVVERAIDRLAGETQGAADTDRIAAQMDALLTQLDRVPDRADAFDPLRWDAQGLPR